MFWFPLFWKTGWKRYCYNLLTESILPMFSSRRFITSSLTFRSLNNFELIFVCGVKEWSNFIFLHVSAQFRHTICWRDCLSNIVRILPPCHRLISPRCVDSFLDFLSCSLDLYYHFFVPVPYWLVTTALWYWLKSGSLRPPALVFFLKIAFSIWSLLCLHTDFKIFFDQVLWKIPLVIW